MLLTQVLKVLLRVALTCKSFFFFLSGQYNSVSLHTFRPAVLNQLHIAAACLGNHDFDFGMPQLEKLIGQTNFPWLLSNVLNGEDTAHEIIQRYLIVEHVGLRIGFIGLVEK